MTLADTHVKNLLKEGTSRAGTAPSGSDWRISPEAVTAAKERAEEFLREVGAEGARAAAAQKRSTLKAEDMKGQSAPAEEPDAVGF